VADVVILNCYRLAKVYSRNPAEFLSMPLDEVAQHLKWTEKLFEGDGRNQDGR
jgi:hypothetical protein